MSWSPTNPVRPLAGDGITDDWAALAAADAAQVDEIILHGIHRVASNLAVGGHVRFDKGAILKPDSGVTITLADTIDAGLFQIFDTSAGGSFVFGATARPGRLRPEWWGAILNNVADDTAAMLACVAAAETISAEFGFDLGTAKVTSTIQAINSIPSFGPKAEINSTAAIAFRLGGSAGQTMVARDVRLPRLVAGTAHTNIGVKLTDVDACCIWIPSVYDFADGIVLAGDGQGVSYNQIFVGECRAWTRNVVFDGVNAGWSTQNTFVGGRFDILQTGTSVAGVRQVQLGLSTSAFQPNGNMFVGCSFEGDEPQYHVEFYGSLNHFIGCRFEVNAGNPRFSFQTNAGVGSIGNTITNGYETNNVDIAKSAESSGNAFYLYATDRINRAGPSVVQHSTSDSNPLAQIVDTTVDLSTVGPSTTNYRKSETANATRFKATADTTDRLTVVHTTGQLEWSSGSAATDVNLFRQAAGNLAVRNATNPILDVIDTGSGEAHRLRLETDTGTGTVEIISTQSSGATYPLLIKAVAAERARFDATGVTLSGSLGVNGAPPVAKSTGWGAPTGTATKTTFDTASVTVSQLAERVKALLDYITSRGDIGA